MRTSGAFALGDDLPESSMGQSQCPPRVGSVTVSSTEGSGRLVRYWWLIGLVLLLCTAAPAAAQISIGIGVPSLDIGIHLGAP
jgi:hypothetical protein